MPYRRALLIFLVVILSGAHGAESAATRAPEPHAIVELRQQCLLGGVENRKWVAADKLGPALKGSHHFALYQLDGPAGDVTANVGENPDCSDSWSAEPSTQAGKGVAIMSPDWNPLPRVPRAINPRDATYLSIVGQILREAGLRKPEVNIDEGYKVDLDGDGKDEVVLVASRHRQGVSELTGVGHGASPGDYSLVLVRKLIGSRVRNIFLVRDVRLKENEGGLVRGYHLSAIADLNGDGRMEIALYSAYYEGSSTDVIEINGATPKGVLSCGCEH